MNYSTQAQEHGNTVVVIGTGGTISSRISGNGGSAASDLAKDLVRATGGVAASDVETIDVLKKNSFQLTFADMRTIANIVQAQINRPEVCGVVVTHGTDTLEETSFLCHLTVDSEKPVVFTGAQRQPDSKDSDGPANLRDSITVASDPSARGLGVLVVFSGRIYSAEGLRKMHTIGMSPFGSCNSGILGLVLRTVSWTARPVERKHVYALPEAFDRIRVDVVPTYPGADAAIFKAAINSGSGGVVVEATGCGNANNCINEEIHQVADRGIPVVLATRVVSGPVIPIYTGGGGWDAVINGAIPAGFLSVAQARILLAVLLANGPGDIAKERFAEYVSCQLNVPVEKKGVLELP